MDTIRVDAEILSKLKHDIERAEHMPVPFRVRKIFKYLKEELLDAIDKGDSHQTDKR